MKENQTPQKLTARSAENRIGRLKDFPSKKNKSNKISNKCLNESFASLSEESVDLSPISDITHTNFNEDVTTFLLEESSSVTLLQPDTLQSEKITDTTENSSSNCFDICEFTKFACVEDEIAMNFLKNVKPNEILTSSVNAAPQYRKITDEIIQYVTDDLNSDTLPVERCHRCSQLQVRSRKNRFLSLCVFICFIGVLVVILFTPDVDCGLVPT
ncbi:uncharacterized protein [Cicer arietinum]|uniref:uncharacterized protein n=1 Tax=Cicer arietinum TaxID=3827 RepID=UPI00064159B2